MIPVEKFKGVKLLKYVPVNIMPISLLLIVNVVAVFIKERGTRI